mgnify:FL=1
MWWANPICYKDIDMTTFNDSLQSASSCLGGLILRFVEPFALAQNNQGRVFFLQLWKSSNRETLVLYKTSRSIVWLTQRTVNQTESLSRVSTKTCAMLGCTIDRSLHISLSSGTAGWEPVTCSKPSSEAKKSSTSRIQHGSLNLRCQWRRKTLILQQSRLATTH